MIHLWNCSRKNFVFLFGALINLIVRVDAYFHPIRMIYPIQSGLFFRAASNWGKPAKLYQYSRVQSSVTAPIIPGPYPVLDYSTKYNPSGSRPGLNDTTYSTPLPQPCPPPSSLSATAWKNRSKVPSRKVTIHCPAPRCDSLKERPMTTSEKKRVYRQPKTGLRRVYVVKQKKKKKYNSDFCSR